MGITVMSLGGKERSQLGFPGPPDPGAGELLQRVQKKLDQAHSEDLRGRSLNVPQVPEQDAHHRLF